MEFEELEGDPVLGGLVRHVRKLTDELAAAESSITVFAKWFDEASTHALELQSLEANAAATEERLKTAGQMLQEVAAAIAPRPAPQPAKREPDVAGVAIRAPALLERRT